MPDEKPSRTRKLLKEFRAYGQVIIVALLVTTFLFTTTAVAGSSMRPNLNGGVDIVRSPADMLKAAIFGDRLFIPKYETWLRRMGILEDYQRGDIIIVREHADSPCRSTAFPALLIKRLIALPGDSLKIKAGRVFINGQELNQSFITEKHGMLGWTNFTEMTIPEGQYFVLGDNRPNSCDSRIYGTVSFMQITGKATAIIWPPQREGIQNWRSLKRPEAFEVIK